VTQLLLALALIAFPGVAFAQAHQPYVGLERRAVKALGDDEIADLRAGRGMGLALAAELNGYPGPRHVLEHADALALTPEQRQRTQALHDAMQQEAIALGEQLIAREAHLDRLFAERTIDEASLAAATRDIGLTHASLRGTHLKYHLAMMQVLSADQVSRYGALRGYVKEGGGAHDPALRRQHSH
jgi:Spy/CpxP family protein refolding chaperone